ncbi:MAG TPA: hypothetical protein VF750_08585, partial [Sphingomicrobium sp.]
MVVTGTLIRSQRSQTPTPLASKSVGSDPAIAASLSHLQGIVRNGNRAAIARIVSYPLRVSAAGGTRLYP